jgi:two-component system KDP operon response regulator KdpE
MQKPGVGWQCQRIFTVMVFCAPNTVRYNNKQLASTRQACERKLRLLVNTYYKILVVEDDMMTREVVTRQLEKADFRVLAVEDGRQAMRQFFDIDPDLVILDINMPNMDGYTVCQRIRELSNVPIIMLTANVQPEEIVKGLELGADDYITKPFNKEVLIARTHANLRRAKEMTEPAPSTSKSGLQSDYDDGYLTVYFDQRRVLIEHEQIHLSPTEFRLMEMLINEAPRVLPYRNILESVWGFEYADDINYLRVYVWHLRNKIEPDPKEPIYFINELGVGYRFEPKK